MYIPKRYGESKKETCPFCSRQGTVLNKDGLVVCVQHRNCQLDGLKCLCGSPLVPKTGKYGAFFGCDECGTTMNIRKALEINEDLQNAKKQKLEKEDNKAQQTANLEQTTGSKKENSKPSSPKEIFIRSDDPNYFD